MDAENLKIPDNSIFKDGTPKFDEPPTYTTSCLICRDRIQVPIYIHRDVVCDKCKEAVKRIRKEYGI